MHSCLSSFLDPHTFIVTVARFPRIKLLDNENVLMFMGSAGCCASAAAPCGFVVVAGARESSRDEAADIGAAPDAALEDVTALCATGATVELELDGEEATFEAAFAAEAFDEAVEVTVCKVVAAIDAAGIAAGVPAGALLVENDPPPQRQEHAQEPSGFSVPVPFTMAPGEPTAGARRPLVFMKTYEESETTYRLD